MSMWVKFESFCKFWRFPNQCLIFGLKTSACFLQHLKMPVEFRLEYWTLWGNICWSDFMICRPTNMITWCCAFKGYLLVFFPSSSNNINEEKYAHSIKIQEIDVIRILYWALKIEISLEVCFLKLSWVSLACFILLKSAWCDAYLPCSLLCRCQRICWKTDLNRTFGTH